MDNKTFEVDWNRPIASLKKARKQLVGLGKAMPDKDAYAMAYAVVADMVEEIDECLKLLGPAIEEAKADEEQNKLQLPNRAKTWCIIE